MRTIAIVQARMQSTRLPGKVLEHIAGKAMVHHVVDRVLGAESVDEAVVATTTDSDDDVLYQYCVAHGIACYRGSVSDVIDRYCQAAREHQADDIVRVTADCPLLDPDVVEKVVRVFHAGHWDYVSNVLEPTYPDGLDVEAFSFSLLEQLWREVEMPSEREHVTLHVRLHPEKWRQANVRHTENLGQLRWTVDHPQDLEFVRLVYQYLQSERFGLSEVMELVRSLPELAQLNESIARDLSALEAMREDGLMPFWEQSRQYWSTKDSE